MNTGSMYMYCQCSDPRKIIDKITQYTFFWSYINFIGTQKKIVIVFLWHGVVIIGFITCM